MIDQSQLIQLGRHTQDALAHLYDLPYLRRHPLARELRLPGGPEGGGRALRRALLDSLQDLKPPPDSPHDTAAVARYQFLYLRYVQGKSMDEIAKQLALSERQLYRRQREALDVVTSTLARRLMTDLAGEARAGGGIATAFEPASASRTGTASEIDRIGTARPTDPADIAQVLQGVMVTVAHLVEKDGLSISISLGSDLKPVAADRVAVRQAMLGLLTFVIEVSPPGEIAIAVNAVDGRIDVRFRLNPKLGRRRAKFEDDDSNLAVCRRLIELQGGSVQWQTANQWDEVIVSLPIAYPRSVLIVDDNADTLQLFGRYLETRAHHVRTASSGEEAVRIVSLEHPDAVILDVMLPSADGYEALQAMRSDPETSDIPVVVCTVLKQHDLAMSLGATEFVAKPTTREDLLGALERCWARSRSEYQHSS